MQKEWDFIQLPPSMGFKHVLVIVCLFSGCVDVEVFPCQKATAFTVAKKLLDFFFCFQAKIYQLLYLC